ncbi:nuclear export mediator factor NEMF [Nematocida homosporus]|uniref:nuclear export mediator factor NEMF n=1 Tax=Nematocida homosporus TaxID=1912981 RepID=UPI0022211C6D|nr:nuclear export mediator factor NEMF [Nematocida homosporus]KAI5186388.1 nuclear export mediator factor NEMF [Nematocida homosporus]
MKGRLSWLDIRAGVNEAQKLIGAHIKSVYSISKKSILIKFSNKENLLIDPPSKFHLTYTTHPKINLTPIAIYLRKVLNNCRVEKVYQLGFDRVAALQLGSAEGLLVLFIEMYANGNIILTDKNLKIMNLLRPVEHLDMHKESVYPLNVPQLELNLERYDYLTGDTLKKKIASFLSLSGRIVDDVLGRMQQCFSKQFNLTQDLTLESLTELREKQPDEFGQCFHTFFGEIFSELVAVGSYGAVVYEQDRPVLFTPWRETNKDSKRRTVEFDSFGKAMDAAFAVPVVQETVAEKKIRKIRESQEKSLKQKLQESENLRTKAQFLTTYQAEFTKAIQIILAAVDSGIAESEFLRFKQESEATNPIAKYIKAVSFANKTVTLTADSTSVTLSYTTSFYDQISQLFQQAKKIEDKAIKARAALEESNQKSDAMEQRKEKAVKIEKINRPVLWFEKFHWFITKNNDLIIAGRDAKQNEILIKKHLKDSDYYFHADIQGGSSVIVGESATEETKETASYMAMILSRAWEKGVVVPVYSVRGSQVSKTAPAGEYLSQGSFMIAGKREFYHPYKLEYGLGLIYKVPMSASSENVGGEEESDRRVFGFTSLPTVEPEYVLPLAGPYKSIEGPKYRLLPGNQKKGMIIKDILALAEEDAQDKLKYVRNITGREMELAIISNCKLAQAEIARRGEASVFKKKDKKKAKAKSKTKSK